MTTYTVKHNTDLAISWIADDNGNTIGSPSQDIPALRTECKRLNNEENDVINNDEINNGLAFCGGAAAAYRNSKKVDPFCEIRGIFYAYRAACELGDFQPSTAASNNFISGWDSSVNIIKTVAAA